MCVYECRHDRVVEYLDSAVCRSEASRWSNKTAHLLSEKDGISYHSWTDFEKGVSLSGAVDSGLGGGLHALLKLVDEKGGNIGQAVIPVPVGSFHGKSGNGNSKRVTAKLTRHTEEAGSLTCTVQVLKVRE